MRNATLAVAESCTGGLLGERITSVSGSSRYFKGGAVVYSNQLKTRTGRRSRRYDRAARRGEPRGGGRAGGRHSLSFRGRLSGSASPALPARLEERPEKPVGLVFHALASDSGTEVIERNFPGDRKRIRWFATTHGAGYGEKKTDVKQLSARSLRRNAGGLRLHGSGRSELEELTACVRYSESMAVTSYAYFRRPRHRRCHPRADCAFSGWRARICARCALGAAGIVARHAEVHRREAGAGGGAKSSRRWRQFGAARSDISLRGYGFFPTAKAPRVFWIGIRSRAAAGGAGGYGRRDDGSLGIAKEDQPSARTSRWRAARQDPARLAGRKATAPTRTFNAAGKTGCDAGSRVWYDDRRASSILYQSQLSPKGAKYTQPWRVLPLRHHKPQFA